MAYHASSKRGVPPLVEGLHIPGPRLGPKLAFLLFIRRGLLPLYVILKAHRLDLLGSLIYPWLFSVYLSRSLLVSSFLLSEFSF
jgi:hypothetical protein